MYVCMYVCQTRQCCAVLFVDLREAFHRIVRPLIHGGDLQDHHLAGIVKELGLPADSVHRLYTYVETGSLIEAAGATPWTARMMKEFNSDAWFTYGQSAQMATVRGGTRPGDTLADMVFSFLFAEILDRVGQRFKQAGIGTVLPWSQAWLCCRRNDDMLPDATCQPVDITWMDDLAVLISNAPSPGL